MGRGLLKYRGFRFLIVLAAVAGCLSPARALAEDPFPNDMDLRAAYCLDFFQEYTKLMVSQVPTGTIEHDALVDKIAQDTEPTITHIQRYLYARGAFDGSHGAAANGLNAADVQAKDDFNKELVLGPNTPYFQCAQKSCHFGSVALMAACREKLCARFKTDAEAHQEACWSLERQLPF